MVGIRPVMVTTPEPFLVLSAAQQAQPDYRGARRRVDHVIDLARHEPGCEVNIVSITAVRLSPDRLPVTA